MSKYAVWVFSAKLIKLVRIREMKKKKKAEIAYPVNNISRKVSTVIPFPGSGKEVSEL